MASSTGNRRSSQGGRREADSRRRTSGSRQREYYEEDDYYQDMNDGYYEDEEPEDDYYSSRSSSGSSRRSSGSRSSSGRSSRGTASRSSSSRKSSGKTSSKKAAARKKAKRRKRIVLFIAEILILLVLGIVVWAVLKQTSTQKININEEEIKVNFNETVEENETLKGYRNIALFGIDARDDNLTKNNRSDTIIIASINQDTGDVKLCSVYRDTYMNLGNDRYSKCNAAYAAGGPQQAIQMLNMNLDMNITDFVAVGFTGLIDVIDSLGGVEIDVQSNEIEHLNNYQASMYSTESKEKLTNNYTKVTSPGRQVLNGMQATAYCRIRYTAGDDFRRAERQRTVLMAILEKAKNAPLDKLNAALDSALPHVATSLGTSEMLEVLSTLTSYNIVGSDGFPFEDSRTTGKVGKAGSCVIPLTLASNVSKLHEFLFDNSDYQVSDAVKSYSARVSADTGY